MAEKIDYSKYRCPYEHLKKECGHELKGPEGYEGHSVWCACGYRGPVFYLNPEQLKLELKTSKKKYAADIEVTKVEGDQTWVVEACSKEEAFDLWNKGEGDVVHEELNVQGLRKPSIDEFYEYEE
jgi:hypothetical protein